MRKKVSSGVVVSLVVACLCMGVWRYGFGGDRPEPPSSLSRPSGEVDGPSRSGRWGSPHGHLKPLHSCWASMSLDDAQRGEVKKIYEANKSKMEALRAERDAKQEGLEKALKAGDEQDLRKAFGELSRVREEILVLRMKIAKEVGAVLKEEQKRAFEDCLQHKWFRMHRRWEQEFAQFLEQP